MTKWVYSNRIEFLIPYCPDSSHRILTETEKKKETKIEQFRFNEVDRNKIEKL